jgi:hypothetical protein
MRIPDNCPLHTSSPTSRHGIDADTLARANINPVTGLATDYLNRFNEVIMLLEMLPSMPDCVEDILAWRSMSYSEHFAASHFKDRELAIAAYDIANPAARQRLDELAEAMNAILQAIREALILQLSPEAAGTLAQQAAGWLKPLVARAGAVINGHHICPVEEAEDEDDAPQAAVDALFEH